MLVVQRSLGKLGIHAVTIGGLVPGQNKRGNPGFSATLRISCQNGKVGRIFRASSSCGTPYNHGDGVQRHLKMFCFCYQLWLDR